MVVISILIFLPFSIFISILFLSQESLSEAISFVGMFIFGGIGVFMIILLPIFILSILVLWSSISGKSRVELFPDRMNIHLAGGKGEWVENTIRFRHVVKAQTIGHAACKDLYDTTPTWKRILFRRPRNPGGGFYHNFTNPKYLIRVDMAGMQRIVNFNEHSMSNYGEGSVRQKIRVMDMDGMHICSSSGRIVTGSDRRHYGPAIEKYQVSRIYLGIKKKDRDQFITMVNELVKLNRTESTSQDGPGGVQIPVMDLEIVGW